MSNMKEETLEYIKRKVALSVLSPPHKCKICGGESPYYSVVDFNKSCNAYYAHTSGIPVFYRMCKDCKFLFTDMFDNFTPDQWSDAIYNSDYINVDPEYANKRPIHNARQIAALLSGMKSEIIGLDYGGGSGIAAQKLRQYGWTFDTYDPYGCNDTSAERIGHYNFCSSFEVFEHTPDPIGTMENITSMCSKENVIILVGTLINDGAISFDGNLSWWYASPRNGHISLYSRESMRRLASTFSLDYSWIANGTHLFTRGFDLKKIRYALIRGKILRRVRAALAKARLLGESGHYK